jgi:hypothetical protein
MEINQEKRHWNTVKKPQGQLEMNAFLKCYRSLGRNKTKNEEDDMRVCGVELSGRDAIIVILDGNRGSWNVVRSNQRKISLLDDDDSQQIKYFRNAFNSMAETHGIQRVAIMKRLKKGRFAGGAVSFKMEALIQLIETCQVVLLPPQTVTRVAKDHADRFPAGLQEYQKEAFNTALTALDDY